MKGIVKGFKYMNEYANKASDHKDVGEEGQPSKSVQVLYHREKDIDWPQ